MVLGLAEFFVQYFFSLAGWGVANKGVSFGVLIPGLIWYLMFGLFLVFGYRSRLLLAGALGNLLSRLTLGYIWDYIKIPYVGLWFNLSDVMIVLATGFLIWKMK